MTTRIGPGTRAIVTGASWGIGETFAEALAARGADLLLVARSENRLRGMATELAARHRVRVEVVTVDLAAPDGPEGVRPRLALRRKVTREQVVASALDALERDLPIVVPGAPPPIARLALSLLPRRWRLRLTGLLLRRFPTMLTGTRRRDP